MKKKKCYQTWLGACGLAILMGLPVQADLLYSMAKQIAKGTKKLHSKRIAVLLFPYENGDVSSGSSLVSDELTTLLSQYSDIKVVERSQLANMLTEVKLEESGVTTASGTAKTGEVLNVDAVVTGTLTDLRDDKTEVNAHLIELPTGEVLTGAVTRIDRVWDDEPRPPVTLAENTSDDDYNAQFQDSPLIFTPWARGGGAPPITGGGSMAMATSQPPSPSAIQSSVNTAPPVSNAPVITQTGWVTPWNPVRAQLLYAMGLTLDTQGHHHQAQHFYHQVAQAVPASSPLHDQAQRQLTH